MELLWFNVKKIIKEKPRIAINSRKILVEFNKITLFYLLQHNYYCDQKKG